MKTNNNIWKLTLISLLLILLSVTNSFASENKLIRKILYNNFQKIDYLEKKVNELEKVIHILKDKDDQIDLIEQKQLL